MLVLTVVFLITISLNSSSVNELSKSAKLISDQYLSLETYSSTLVKIIRHANSTVTLLY